MPLRSDCANSPYLFTSVLLRSHLRSRVLLVGPIDRAVCAYAGLVGC